MDQAALRQELAELTAAVRAFVEWHAITGAVGLPGGGAPLEGAAPEPAQPAQARGEAAWEPPPALAEAPPPPSPQPPQQPAPEPQHQPRSMPQAHAQQSHAQAQARPQAPPPPVAADAEPPWQRRSAAQSAPVRAAAPADAHAHAPSAPAPVLPPLGNDSAEERRARLTVLADEVRGCQKCGLHAGRTQTVFHRGNPASEVAFVGEGPGMEEDLGGEPFVGPAGQLLDKMIVAMGYRRDDVYICNIVKCRPPNNRKPEPDEMSTCMPYLTAQLSVVRPKVIVALGATAVQGMLGTSEGITRLRGTWKLHKGTPVMPTFHPAYLLRQPNAKREVWSDLKEVMRFLHRPVPERG